MDSSDIQVGDVWQANDPRNPRRVTVLDARGHKIKVRPEDKVTGRASWIDRSVFGTTLHKGYTLVERDGKPVAP